MDNIRQFTYESIIDGFRNKPEVRFFLFFNSNNFLENISEDRIYNINALLRTPFKSCAFLTKINHNQGVVYASILEISPGVFVLEGPCARGNDLHIVNIKVDCLTNTITPIKFAQEVDYDGILAIVGRFLEILSDKNSIVGKSKKSKNPLFRNKCKYKNVVFVSDKRYIKQNVEQEPTLIEWSHRWEVMGHWRRCSTVGKDRDGNYNVIGLTWVSPHIRGEGELVIKTRIVKGELACSI